MMDGEDTGEQGQVDAGGRDYESEARMQGWKPLEEFNGDPEKHKSAEQFVKDGEEKLSLSNARVKHLTDALQSLQRKQARAEKDFVAIRELMSGMEKRAYDKAIADLTAQQEAAVETGDVATFKEVGRKIEQLRDEAKPEDKPKPQGKYDKTEIQRKYADFVAENEWFDEGATGGAKRAMTVYASTIADEMGMIDDFDGTPDEYFGAIAEKVKERYADRYPEMFGLKKDDEDEPAPKKRSAVEGVNGSRPARGVKTAAHLDADARRQGERFVNMGLFKSIEDYAKEYHANVG